VEPDVQTHPCLDRRGRAIRAIFAASPVDPCGYTGGMFDNQNARIYFTGDSNLLYGEVLTSTSALQAWNFFGSSGSAVPA
jgi:hypothetical protein